MATLRNIVSSIRGMNKLFSNDNKITDRLIASEVRSTSYMIIKQQTDRRRLWSSATLFTELRCIEMIEVPLAECCDYKTPCTIRRSKYKLPKIAEGNFNLLIQGVYNINGTDTYEYADPNRYANILKLGLKNKQQFYWIRNKYLYITDINIEKAAILAFFTEDIDPLLDSCGPSDPCQNPLDKEFTLPDDLERNLKDIVYDRLNKTYFSHIQDPTNDGKDDAR